GSVGATVTDDGTFRVEAAGKTVEVVYEVGNGLTSSRGTVTVRTAEPYNNPPVAFDAFGSADDGDSVEVDVLETAYDPDGPSEDLVVAEVLPPAGVRAEVEGSTITVVRGPQPMVVPFRVEDADDGATTASLYVPPASNGLPYVEADGLIQVDPGESVDADLDDYVVNPSGGPVQFTLKNRIWPSPLGSVGATVTDDGTFRVEAAGDYEGPGAVTFEVTTGSGVDDPDGRTAILTVPVQVGEERPFLRCPTEPLEIPQGSAMEIDVASVCHAWTADPADADDLEFTADWQSSLDGLSIVEPEGAVIEIAASGSAEVGVTTELELRTEGSVPALLPLRVIDTPPPSLSPIRIADMKAGETRTVDLSTYLNPGVPDPEPTIMSVTPETDLDIQAVKSDASELTLTTGPKVDGTARFRVVMSDVDDPLSDDRRVEGILELEVLDVPDTPTAPVPGRTVRSEEVALSWRAPQDNGAPIEYYEVRDDRGDVTRCGTTSCDVGGLTNGESYRFQVRAVNAVGESGWSDSSAAATPDAKPGIVGPIEMVGRGDGSVSLRWTPPTTQTSAIRRYWVSYQGGPSGGRPTTVPRITVPNLNNNQAQAFTVVAENALDYGTPRTSEAFQSIGRPGTPNAPTVTDQQTGDGETAVTVAWNAVDPNGPTPVHYTVLRNGQPLAQCSGIAATSCDDTGLTYDGTIYTYSVKATNNGGVADAKSSPAGPGTQWAAVGKPAAWDESWTVTPTGANTEARVNFTVPPSRGAQSEVSILVDGVVRHTMQATGAQAVNISVGDNDRAHSIQLQVCNEKGNCSPSGTKAVQTYGPFASNHIISSQSHVREVDVNTYEVWWTITVDNNGDPARVRITSRSGDSDAIRNETYNMSSVDVQSFTTEKVRLDAYKSDIIFIHLEDTSPFRREVKKEDRYTTPERKQPGVSVTQGSRCSDNPGSTLPKCNVDGAGTDCWGPECARIKLTTVNFVDDRIRCGFYDANGQFGPWRWVDSNATREPGGYYGNSGNQIWATCNGVTSPHYRWP
ncbi:MAG: fibronectin type III domain-containing protein, partial [Nocardioides sp.]